jgi:hypothetical protein
VFFARPYQGDGKDLDPGHGMASADAQRKGPGPKGRKPILVGDSLDPMVSFIYNKKNI